MRSRYGGAGIGAQVFQSTAPPSCPPGTHYVPDAAGPIRGLGACVNNVPPLTFHRAAAPAPAPAPAAPAPVTFRAPAPSPPPAPAGDRAPAPAPALTCPDPWPWWWLVVAALAGGGLGYYMQKNQKAVRTNARRVATRAGHRIVHRASDAALSRLIA